MTAKKAFVLGVIALVFLSACIKEPAIEHRLLCLDLTSYSKAAVPKCNSQEKCFAEVKKAFEDSKTVFPPLIENNLSELKNRVALSWLYFNRALENLHSINDSCLNSKDLVGLDKKANELNHNLVRAFEENDKAHALAFSILLLQKSHLENQEIELIKEEKLFDDFIAINNNLNEFDAGRAFGKNSFASNYFLNIKRLEELSSKVNFEQITIAQITIFDIINGFDEKILARVPKKPFYLPMIADSVSSLIEYITNTFTLQQAVKLMESVPSFELFEVYNRFAGTNDSSIEKFFELNQSIKSNIKEINLKNEEKKEEIAQEFELIEGKISQIDEATYSNFDKDFLSELALLLSESSSIEENIFEINEFDKVKVEATSRLLELRGKFNDLSSKEFLFEISLGEKTSKLKDLRTNSRLLNENLDFLTRDAFGAVVDSCDRQALLVEDRISKTDYWQFDEHVLVLVERIKSKVSDFKQALDEREKLLLCKPIVEEFNSLNKAIENFDEFKLLEKEGFENCFLKMKQIFETGSGYFLDLKPLYSKLLALSEIKKEGGLLKTCKNLEEKVAWSFNEMEEVQEITSNHKKSKDFFEKLEVLKNHSSQTVSESTFLNLKKKLEGQRQFFDAQELIPSKALQNLAELKESSLKLLGELKKVFSKSFSTYLENNTKIITTSDNAVKANAFTTTKIKIAIKNDLADFDESLSLKLDLKDLSDITLETASPNVAGIKQQKDFLAAELKSAPAGLTKIFLSSNTVLAKTKESLKPLFLTQNTALMEKEVIVESKTKISLLEVSTALAEFSKIIPESINVLFKQQSLPFSLEGEKIHFKANNVSNKDRISIFYEIKEPLKIDFRLVEQNKIGESNFEYVFLARIENTTDLEFKKARVLLPIPVSERSFSKIKVFDSTGKEVSIEKTLLNNVSVTIPEIFPKQTKEFLTKLEVKNYSEYWSGFIEELERKIQALTSNENETLRENAAAFKQEIEQIKKEADFQNSEKLEELTKLSLKINETLNESDVFESEKVKFIELKKQLEEEIEKAKEKIMKLEKLGYKEDAKELEDTIEKVVLFKRQAQKKLSTEPKSAFLTLLNAKNSLTEISPPGFIQSIKKQKEGLMEKANKLFELKTGKKSKQEIMAIEEEISGLIGENEFILASEKVELLNEKVSTLEKEIKEKTKEMFFEKKEKLNLFSELAENIPKKIELLKKLAESNSKKENSNYFFPTTLQRLDKLSLKFNSLADSSLIEKIESIDLNDEKDFVNQFIALEELGNDFDKKLESLKKIDKELSGDLKKIEEDAKTVLEFAKIKSKQAILGDGAEQALFLAEQKIESKEFVESMELSKKAIGLMGLQSNPKFNVPLAVFPLVLIIIAALYFRYRKKNTALPQKVKIKKVEEQKK